MENQLSLIILRGVPGSGKTTLAHLISEYVCSADDYVYNEDGEYVWTPERVYVAHKKCQTKCKYGMELKISKIVISNTSPKTRDLKPYMKLAEEFGYQVHTVIVENRHGGTNSHNVSEEHIENMKKNFNIKL